VALSTLQASAGSCSAGSDMGVCNSRATAMRWRASGAHCKLAVAISCGLVRTRDSLEPSHARVFRLVYTEGVGGSSPSSPTSVLAGFRPWSFSDRRLLARIWRAICPSDWSLKLGTGRCIKQFPDLSEEPPVLSDVRHVGSRQIFDVFFARQAQPKHH